MRLGDSHIEKAFRETPGQMDEPRSVGHRGRDSYDVRIFFGQLDQGAAEHLGVCRDRR
jgi:hypothetical protein